MTGVNLTVVVFERWWVVVLGTVGFEFGCRGERRSREVTTVTNSDRSFIFPPVISISHLSVSSLIFHLSVVFQKKNGEDQRKSWDEKRKRPVSSSSSCNLSSLSVSSLCRFFFFWTQICRVWEDKRRGQNTISTFGLKKLRVEIAILVYYFQPIENFLFLYVNI